MSHFTHIETRFQNLFYLEKVNGIWTKPKKLDQNINSSYWDSQPFIYKDKLFFVSNRPGGKGGRDIYYSKINNDGSFTNAVNFDIVNTSYEEVSPSYFEDIFYFSSNMNFIKLSILNRPFIVLIANRY